MTGAKKRDESKVERQLKQILERLDAVEDRIDEAYASGEHEFSDSGAKQHCGLPLVPTRKLQDGIDPIRERLIRSIEKKWVNGTTLKYYFFENKWSGGTDQVKIVKHAFDEWKDVGIGLNFTEVDSPELADIRIGFKIGDGSWSYVGRDIWDIPHGERTMNFGWRLAGQDGRDTALHEIGHTLGFHHEQQNPFAGIVWDEDAVFRYFSGPPNYWSRDTIIHNVLRKINPNTVEGSEWDPNSIMQYSIPSGLILRPEHYRNGLHPEPGLSEIDKAQVRLFYPEIEEDLQELKPFKSRILNLQPAGQEDFVIKPQMTRSYRIQSFGNSDVLMVLFEDSDGSLEHFAADDDSGWDRNADLSVRLVRGREYVLRVRVYTNGLKSENAVMLW